MRISDWSSDVCSSDLRHQPNLTGGWSESTHEIAALHGEPQYAGGIEDRRMWIARPRFGHRELPDLTGRRVEAANEPCRDRKSVVSGKRVSGRVDPGGRRIINKKKYINNQGKHN